jgi:hypothetical protein
MTGAVRGSCGPDGLRSAPSIAFCSRSRVINAVTAKEGSVSEYGAGMEGCFICPIKCKKKMRECLVGLDMD